MPQEPSTKKASSPKSLPPGTAKFTAPSLVWTHFHLQQEPVPRSAAPYHHSSTGRLKSSRAAEQAAGEMVYLISLLQTRQGCLFTCFNLPEASKMWCNILQNKHSRPSQSLITAPVLSGGLYWAGPDFRDTQLKQTDCLKLSNPAALYFAWHWKHTDQSSSYQLWCEN